MNQRQTEYDFWDVLLPQNTTKYIKMATLDQRHLKLSSILNYAIIFNISCKLTLHCRTVPREHRSLKCLESYSCGGGVEYFHRDPASRRRRRKGKSQIWDSKIWSRVSDPRKIALVRTSSMYKRQTRPHIRESGAQKQDRSCQRLINIWS
jgi:hypothetical protein